MIEEPATVIFVDDGYAMVETQQRPACGSCASTSSCSTSVLSGLFKRRYTQIRVSNPIAAKPGEQVIIGLEENALLKISFLAYLLPLLCMMLMAILMRALATHLAWQLGELPQVLGGLFGLMTGYVLLQWFAGHKQNESRYQAVILRPLNTARVGFSKDYPG
jgi:sigma-E factor negative regulatory protein RseC